MGAMSTTDRDIYSELVGIYHADGSLLGELRYLWGKLRGTAHCALCDITHATVREKAAFRQCRERLPIPLRVLHLDERSEALTAVTEGRTPCVVGRNSKGWVMVMDARSLEACQSSVESFENELWGRLRE